MCPECGARKGKVCETDYSESLGWQLRVRICDECRTRYSTIEIPLPSEVSLHKLGTERRDQRRINARKARGFYDTAQGRYLRPRYRLEVLVRVFVSGAKGGWKLIEEIAQKP